MQISNVDTTGEWITRRTGIKERRISLKGAGESTTDLATSASLKACILLGDGAGAVVVASTRKHRLHHRFR